MAMQCLVSKGEIVLKMMLSLVTWDSNSPISPFHSPVSLFLKPQLPSSTHLNVQLNSDKEENVKSFHLMSTNILGQTHKEDYLLRILAISAIKSMAQPSNLSFPTNFSVDSLCMLQGGDWNEKSQTQHQILSILTIIVVTTRVLFCKLSTISEYVSVKFRKKFIPVTSCQMPTLNGK